MLTQQGFDPERFDKYAYANNELSNMDNVEDSVNVIGLDDLDLGNKRGLDLPEFEFNNAYGTEEVDVENMPTDLDYANSNGISGAVVESETRPSSGGGGGGAEAVGALGTLAATLIGNAQAKKQDMQNVAIKSRCGKRPLLTITKKQKTKRAEYNKCVDSVVNPVQAPPPIYQGGVGGKPESSGMSTGAIVGLSVAAGLVLLVGGIFIYKRFSK